MYFRSWAVRLGVASACEQPCAAREEIEGSTKTPPRINDAAVACTPQPNPHAAPPNHAANWCLFTWSTTEQNAARYNGACTRPIVRLAMLSGLGAREVKQDVPLRGLGVPWMDRFPCIPGGACE